MVEPISAAQFATVEGLADWTAEDDTATAVFATGNFLRGVEFVNEIARVAEAQNHHPDVELKYPTVTVRTTTHETGTLTGRDVELALAISGAAVDLGIEPAR